MRWVLAMSATVLLAGCSFFGIRSGYEQPEYAVVERLGDDIEIRRYESRLAAEAVAPDNATGDPADAAFRLLFDYISGANRSGAEISMTAPVATERGTEISMTAPVAVDRTTGSDNAMRFYLPASYTMETAPRPTDPRVKLVDVPAQTVAVLRYSGFRDEAKAAEKQAVLRDRVARSAWKPTGKAISYYYDPPFTLPFLRRNEAVIPVARLGQSGG